MGTDLLAFLWIREEQCGEVFTSNICEAFTTVSHTILACMLRSGWVDKMIERKDQTQRVMVNEWKWNDLSWDPSF